ncbi:MAG: rod shape-determining protein MreD [Peptococcaceae bacterium]|jgi:rod shape-determining protein MreD|nr:rod shape-determining protein MreD [Peptococcaceae bacterium]
MLTYNLSLAGLSLAGLILRSIFPRTLGLAWATPDFPLLLVVFNAMFRGPLPGAAGGFCIGLAEDLFFGRFIGLNALAKGAVGLLTGFLAKSIYKENMWVPVINVFVGSAFSLGVVFAIGHLAGYRWHFTVVFYQGVFELLFNVCLVPFVYGPFFHFADRRLHLREDNG